MSSKASWKALVVSGFGLGYLPLAPGTWGSAGAALTVMLLHKWLPLNGLIVLLVSIIVASTFLGVKYGAWAEETFGGKDAGVFVLDEIAGQWLTCALLFLIGRASIPAIIAAFVAFRIFDVAKPPPIRRIEKLPSGWGMMLDDLLAAVYATAVLALVNDVQPGGYNLF